LPKKHFCKNPGTELPSDKNRSGQLRHLMDQIYCTRIPISVSLTSRAAFSPTSRASVWDPASAGAPLFAPRLCRMEKAVPKKPDCALLRGDDKPNSQAGKEGLAEAATHHSHLAHATLAPRPDRHFKKQDTTGIVHMDTTSRAHRSNIHILPKRERPSSSNLAHCRSPGSQESANAGREETSGDLTLRIYNHGHSMNSEKSALERGNMGQDACAPARSILHKPTKPSLFDAIQKLYWMTIKRRARVTWGTHHELSFAAEQDDRDDTGCSGDSALQMPALNLDSQSSVRPPLRDAVIQT
jgi:hypothetical protein